MREVGIAHSDGVTVMFSASPNRLFGILAKEGATQNDTPEEVSQRIRDRLATNEQRPFMVIVEGGLDWLRRYQQEVKGAHFIVNCSDEATLRAHGVEILDEGWDQQHRQLPPIDQVLLDRPRKGGVLGRFVAGLLAGGTTATAEGKATRRDDKRLCGNCLRRDGSWVVVLSEGAVRTWVTCNTCLDDWRREDRPIEQVTPIDEDARFS